MVAYFLDIHCFIAYIIYFYCFSLRCLYFVFQVAQDSQVGAAVVLHDFSTVWCSVQQYHVAACETRAQTPDVVHLIFRKEKKRLATDTCESSKKASTCKAAFL